MDKPNKEIERLNKMLENKEIDEATYNRQIKSIEEGYNIDYDDGNWFSNNILKLILVPILIIILVIVIMLVVRNIDIGNFKSKSGQNDIIKTKDGVAFQVKGANVELKYVSKYNISGRVVTKKEYNGIDIFDSISPMDIGLSWDKLAYEKNHKKITYSTYNRFLYYSYIGDGEFWEDIGGEDYIVSHCSNNHLIPANDKILNKMNKIKVGDRITIAGYLVNVLAKYSNGSYFECLTSTSRTDTGAGACEVIYVTNIY